MKPAFKAAEAALGDAGAAIDRRCDRTGGPRPAAIELAVTRFGAVDAMFHVAGGSGRRMGDGAAARVDR